jgi:hypothetical protein
MALSLECRSIPGVVDILALGRGLLVGTALAMLTVLAVRTVVLITLGLTLLASRPCRSSALDGPWAWSSWAVPTTWAAGAGAVAAGTFRWSGQPGWKLPVGLVGG